MERLGNKQEGIIMERCRGITSWIRFGGEGLKLFLNGDLTCCREDSSSKRLFV